MDPTADYKVLGLWVNEKKCKKFCLPEFIDACMLMKMRVVKMDLSRPLEEQGPFDIILHKMTAMYAQALDGNVQAREFALRFEKYLAAHPHIPVVDPLPGVHTLLHRPATYALLQALTQHDDRVTTPPYIELGDWSLKKKREIVRKSGLTFPIVCKPVFGCGGTEAHELAVVLSMSRLAEWKGPCVAQSFVPHGAVLYKLYVVGSKWRLALRPSLKNFRATDAPTVHFNSASVSKADSCSPLTQLDQSDRNEPRHQPNEVIFERIVKMVRQSLNMDLLGIDVVIDSSEGRYAIIDVNPFPSYDSYPDLMPSLAKIMVDHANKASTNGLVSNEHKSSIEDLLLPLKTLKNGTVVSSRTRDSRNLNLEELLESRGHLKAIQKLHQKKDSCSPEGHTKKRSLITNGVHNNSLEGQDSCSESMTNGYSWDKSVNGGAEDLLNKSEGSRINGVDAMSDILSCQSQQLADKLSATCINGSTKDVI